MIGFEFQVAGWQASLTIGRISDQSIIANMTQRWLILFTTILALLSTAPRLHCLCNNHDILLVTAAVVECCHSECADTSTSVQGNDQSCFTNVDSQTVTSTCWTPNPVEIARGVSCVQLGLIALRTEISDSIANATRGPPFLPEYSLGLYLLHCVLLI